MCLRRRVAWFTAGGRWTEQLHSPERQSLRWFWFDGLFANAGEAIVAAYLSLFVLALGATRAQIGLMSALSSLTAALFLLPGAGLVERWGRRKSLVVVSGGGVGRVALLLLAFLPLAFSGQAAIAVAIALIALRSAAGNLCFPAWMSLTAEIVPLSWRGRYFSSRNIVMSVAGMATTYLVGLLITRVGGLAGYQIALGLAFAIGALSTYSFARINEPLASGAPRKTGRDSRGSLVRQLREHPGFLAFCATAALWNFSLNVAGPFFNVYLVEGLGATASIVGLLSVVSSLTALPGQRLFGILADRWGPRRVQLLTGLLIPVIPLCWVLVSSPWHVVPINLASGFLWAGYELGSFNFLLAFMPEDRRERYSALYQVIVTVAFAGGAALGGVVAEYWGYKAIFVLSGIGRLIAALLFARLVRQPAEQ
jgi:MFS family permease